MNKLEDDNARKNNLLSEIRKRLTGVAERETDLEEVTVYINWECFFFSAHLRFS